MTRKESETVLSEEEKLRLRQIVQAVDSSRGEEFEKVFVNWKRKWFTGDAAFSSDTRDLEKLPEYQILLSMGPGILPFVVEKMVAAENFVALILYDALMEKGHLKIRYRGVEDPDLFEGEVVRAVRTAKLWLQDAAVD